MLAQKAVLYKSYSLPVYHIDNPTGNIPYNEAIKIDNNSLVDLTIPLSFGDSYKGFRIVGTTHQYTKLYEMSLKEGRLWSRSLEVVLGSTVAQTHQLKIGDAFYGTHGLIEGGHIHDEYAYQVVGILNPSYTILDQLILTNTKSVWQVHNHDVIEQEQERNNQYNNFKHDHALEELTSSELEINTRIPDDAMITFVGEVQKPYWINTIASKN